MATYDVREVETPHGTGRIVQRRASRPRAAVLLNHGAGGGIESGDLQALYRVLPTRGVSVALMEMPWRVAGRKLAPAPRILDECFVAMADRMRPRCPLFVGGRSAGARVACRTGRDLGAVGVVTLAFPLHPPGRPEKSRLDELRGTRLPVHVVQGERDPFGRPEEFPYDQALTCVPGADHSLHVPKRSAYTQEEAHAIVVGAVYDFVVGLT